MTKKSTAQKYLVSFVPKRMTQGSNLYPANFELLLEESPKALAGILLLQGAASGQRPLSNKAIELLSYIMRNNWVCPQHEEWMGMWEMLPEIDGCKPAGPLPLIAWRIWDLRVRHEFLMRNIDCADKRNVIDDVDKYLRSLSQDKWVTGFYGL